MSTPTDNKNEAPQQERGMRLRYLREEVLRLTRPEMKAKLGFPESTIENWEYGRYGGLTERGARKLQSACEQFGINCTVEWLLYGIGQNPESPFLQHLNKIIGKTSLNEAEIIVEELKTFYQLNPGAIDTVIQDNSMLPCLQQGDHVAGIQLFGSEMEKAINKPSIVKTTEGIVLIRFIQKRTSSGQYSLICTNLDVNTTQPVLSNITPISIAPIIWIRRKNNG